MAACVHYIFLFSSTVPSFGSGFFIMATTATQSSLTANTYEQSSSSFSPLPSFPSYTNMCWLGSHLSRAPTESKEAVEKSSSAVHWQWPAVLALQVLPVSIALWCFFLNLVLAPLCEILSTWK